MDVTFSIGDVAYPVTSMRGTERLGEATAFEVEIFSIESIDPTAVLGGQGALHIRNAWTMRVVVGIISRVEAVATSVAADRRRYRLSLRSVFHPLTLRRRSKVFQNLTVPEMIGEVFEKASLPATAFATDLLGKPAKQDYVTQYAETDASFVRRLCEEFGFYFHFETRDGLDTFVLCDDSTEARPAMQRDLVLVDGSGLNRDRPIAFHCRTKRRRTVGKVTLRDYDPLKPDNEIEGVHEAGLAIEKHTEIYRAPVGVTTKGAAKELAEQWLQAVRAEALTHRFETNAVELKPGTRVKIGVGSSEYHGASRPNGEMLVVACDHAWSGSDRDWKFRVTVIPVATPFRLPRITPRPLISGVQSAQITGGRGDEICTDDLGHVRVRFIWDREGPADNTSSKPIRVMQPNLTDSMLIPRVGWEAICAFEDGDPDRPYVLGRTYNGKQRPPYGLPANKTVTALSTLSSPGGGAANTVRFDDAAGAQHMVWNAGLHKTTIVANNMLTQTQGFSVTNVEGAQTRDVGGDENVSVKDALLSKVGSQAASVGAIQELKINAAKNKKVASETVAVGGALIEQVGNPVDGMKSFAEAAALAGVGMIPVVGEALSTSWSAGKAIYEGYKKGGWDGARTAAGQQAAGFVAGKVPGGDAILAGADATGATPWSDKAQAAKAARAAAGGTGGAGAKGATAAAKAPGHKKTIVDGVVSEGIGALHSVTSPGSIKWTTLGAAQFVIGARHTTRAAKVSFLTGGASTDTLGPLSIEANAQHIGRTVKGAMKVDIAGALNSKAGGPHYVKAGGNMTIDVSGSIVADGGAVVFAVGSSIVASHAGGILLKASKVVINGKSKQSGKATNS